MSDNQSEKLTRQQIYQQIRNSSKDEYILSEMIRLGFWHSKEEKPSLTQAFLRRRQELQVELRELGRELSLYENPELALKQLHKHRKQQALKKREQTKRDRNQVRYQKAKAWYDQYLTNISYLGEGISFGLAHSDADQARLKNQQLPMIESSQALAQAMGITINELRFLSFKRSVSKISHYQHFQVPKKTGGVRDIAAPMPRLKRAQYWILENILDVININDAAHGFAKERSIVSNAANHVAKDVVINVDLENFFPSVTFARIKGVFSALGYSEHIATILAALCSQADQDIISLDGERFYVDKAKPCLPQGAPTSPAISNILCRKLDRRMQDVTKTLGFSYSRYADDLTFSADNIDDSKIKKLFWRINGILKDESFKLNHSKTRIMRKHCRQEVTGVVVNQKLSVDRKTLKKFRALLHQMDKHGIAGKHWGNGELFASITGYANFVTMVDIEKGTKLQKQVVHLKRKYQHPVKPGKILELNKKLFRAKAGAGLPARDDWWQAQTKTAPVLEYTANQLSERKKQQREAAKAVEQAEALELDQQAITDVAKKPKRISNATLVFYVIWAVCVYLYWRS